MDCRPTLAEPEEFRRKLFNNLISKGIDRPKEPREGNKDRKNTIRPADGMTTAAAAKGSFAESTGSVRTSARGSRSVELTMTALHSDVVRIQSEEEYCGDDVKWKP